MTWRSISEVANFEVPTYGTVTISSGKGISDAEELSGRAVVRLVIPSTWNATTAPTLSLTVSEDGTTFRPVYYWSSTTPATPALASVAVNTSRSYAIPADWTVGAHSVKIVSGTTASTTPIGKNRVVGLVYRLA